MAEQASVPLSWQQLLGLEPYPKVAGALAQLVHVDTQAAEAACLTLLSRAELRRAMGAAARQRARETFHPDVVMSQIEELFLNLQERRQQGAAAPVSPSPQLDLVSTFASYASARDTGSMPIRDVEQIDSLPLPVRALRAPLWDLLRECLPEERHEELWAEIVGKHNHQQN